MTPRGSRRPYTERGISRVPCLRCGDTSHHQWQICALGNRYFGVCSKCDVILNETVLRCMRVEPLYEIIERYRERLMK